jgi:soluble lytic murein transglycosylase
MEQKKKPFFIILVISTVSLLVGSGCDLTWSDNQRLSAQIVQGLTGTLESISSQPVAAQKAEPSASHIEAADQFIAMMEARNNFFGARYTGCFKQKNPIFCETLYPEKNSRSALKSTSLGVAKNLRLIRQNHLDRVEIGSHTEGQQIIQGLSDSARKGLLKTIVGKKVCTSPHLIASLAFKLEEELPDRKAFNNVFALYERAMSCSKDVYSERGLYRLGLFATLKNQPEIAKEAFEKLMSITDDNNTFKARAQYWLNQVKKDQGEEISNESLQEQFVSFPMSYHVAKDAAEDMDIPFEHTSKLPAQGMKFRSETQESLNNAVQFYEALALKNRLDLGKRVLEFINLTKLAQAEPEFQMYVASLMNNHDDLNHEKFKLLTKVFQNHPQFKTIENLKVYYPLSYSELVLKHSGKQDPALIISLMRQESSFNPETQSPVGAKGLMQIMSRTAKELKSNIKDEELLDPNTNVRLGARYFGALLKEFRGDPHKALAAYNAGAGNVKKWMKRYPVQDELLFADLIPFDETREYVSTILRNRYWYGKLYPELTATKSLALGDPQAAGN